jgi:hypothetical protein
MVPIFWLAFRRGWKIGIFGGAVFGVVDLAIDPFVVNPIQLILDYPLAFAVLGLAGLFQKYPVIGVIVGVTGRFVSHFASGIIYFANYAPAGMSPIVYSAIYNGTYLHTKHDNMCNRHWGYAEKQGTKRLPVRSRENMGKLSYKLKKLLSCIKKRLASHRSSNGKL